MFSAMAEEVGLRINEFGKYIETFLQRACCCETRGCYRPVHIRPMGNSICYLRCDDTHGARHGNECNAMNDTTARLLAWQQAALSRHTSGTPRQLR